MTTPRPQKIKNIFAVFTLYHKKRIIDEKHVTYAAANREEIKVKVQNDSETWANEIIKLRHSFVPNEVIKDDSTNEGVNSPSFQILVPLLRDSCDVRLVQAVLESHKANTDIEDHHFFKAYFKDTADMLEKHLKVEDPEKALQILEELKDYHSVTYTCSDIPVNELLKTLAKLFLERLALTYYADYVCDIVSRFKRASNTALRRRAESFDVKQSSEEEKASLYGAVEKIAQDAEDFCVQQLIKTLERAQEKGEEE